MESRIEQSEKIENMLTERNAAYGNFRDGAKISQQLKKVVSSYGQGLSLTQKESLEMIMHKIARILNGDPMYLDTWEDIIGYSTLAIEDIKTSRLDDLKQDNAV